MSQSLEGTNAEPGQATVVVGKSTQLLLLKFVLLWSFLQTFQLAYERQTDN